MEEKQNHIFHLCAFIKMNARERAFQATELGLLAGSLREPGDRRQGENAAQRGRLYQ
jgi:hypothetical protein